MVSGELAERMDRAVASLAAIPLGEGDDQQLQADLYHLLVLTTSGAALLEIRNCQMGNGLEAWRRLSRRYASAVAGRKLGLLTVVLSPDLPVEQDRLIDALNVWEQNITKYEATGEKLTNDLKIAVVCRQLKEPLRTRALLMVERVSTEELTYAKFREQIEQYLQVSRGWEQSGGSSGSGGPMAMEVDYVGKNGDKRSGRGRGRGQGRGSGRGGKDGAGGSKSPVEGGATPKGQAAGKGGGKKFRGTCHKCGKVGHKAADCRSRSVNEVGGDDDQGEEDDEGLVGALQAGRLAGDDSMCQPCSLHRGNRIASVRCAHEGTCPEDCSWMRWSQDPDRSCPHEGSAEDCDQQWMLGPDSSREHEGISEDCHERQWMLMLANTNADDGAEQELLLDSGAAVHACGPEYAKHLKVGGSQVTSLTDVQGKKIVHFGTRHVPVRLGDPDDAVEALVPFEVSSVRRNVLSVGRLVKAGVTVHLSPEGCWMQRNGRKVNVRQRGNVFCVPGRIMRQSGQETIVAPLEADGGDVVVADEGAAAPAAVAAADPVMAGPPLLGPRPVRPSPDKVAQHELTHLPFAAWCPVCVCGRAADAPHVRRLPDESTEAVVEADYAYLGPGAGLVTLLVATDMDSGAVFATQTPLKGQEGLHAIRSMVT